MALISSLIGATQNRTVLRRNKEETALIPIDATIQITPTYENEVTEHPIEGGDNVTDHIRLKPFTIQVTGIVSENPLTLKNQLAGLASAGGNLLGKKLAGGFGATLGSLAGGKIAAKLLKDGDKSPDVNARDILEEIITQRQMFTLVDKYRTYDDLVMTSLSFPKDQSTGKKLRFQFTAKRIKIVSAVTTDIQLKKIDSKAAHTAKKKEDLGQQAAKPTTEPPSVARGFFNFVTGRNQ